MRTTLSRTLRTSPFSSLSSSIDFGAAVAAVAIAATASLGCGSPTSSATDAADDSAEAQAATGIAVPANLLRVPLVRQQTDYSCGDVAALSVLRYWQWDTWRGVAEDALYAPLSTTAANGTEPSPIAAYLNRLPGISAEYRSDVSIDEVMAAVDRGEPPILDIEAWAENKPDWATDWSDGHYVVMVGYTSRHFFFMDPSTGRHYAYIPRASFESRWHDLVGSDDVKTQHMVIFVHGDAPSTAPRTPPPSVATRID